MLGLNTLALVKQRLPEVEIVLYGATELSPEPPFSFVSRGLLGQDELAALFSHCDIGVVFSLTNPSFVSLEMMACRCAVVEVASERFEGILTHGRDAWLVDPNPDSAAAGIIELLQDKRRRESLVRNAYKRAQTMSWRNSVRQIEAILLRDTLPLASVANSGPN